MAANWVKVTDDYTSLLFNQMTVQKGQILNVDWSKTKGTWVWCKRREKGVVVEEGNVPAKYVSWCMEFMPETLPGKLLCSSFSDEVLEFNDQLFSPPLSPSLSSSSLFSSPLFSINHFFHSHPPVLEPGLDSFVWPLTKEEFMERIWQKKALAVLSSADRLLDIQKRLFDLDTEKLILSATSCVVWMKNTAGDMQHFSADNDVGVKCYKAGHSLSVLFPFPLYEQ